MTALLVPFWCCLCNLVVSGCSLPGAMVCLAPEAAVIWESVGGLVIFIYCTVINVILYIYIWQVTPYYIYILVSLCTGTVQVWIYIYIYCNFLLQQHANRPSAWVHHLQPSPLFFWVKTILSPYRWKEDGGAPFMMGISWEYSGIWGFIGDL